MPHGPVTPVSSPKTRFRWRRLLPLVTVMPAIALVLSGLITWLNLGGGAGFFARWMQAFVTALPVMPLGMLTLMGLDRVLGPRLATWPRVPATVLLAVCTAVRAFSAVPIIMVTARVDEIDRLLGLELGADDYICKPFSPREVIARIKAVLRRGTHTASAASEEPSGGLTMEDGAWRATIAGHDLGLTAVEYQLLKVLSARPGRIFSREQLMDLMYRDERIVSDRTVDSHIKKLRRKIQEQLPEHELIHSVYGLGYRFDPLP